MKKLLTLLLTLSLLCAGVALAETQITTDQGTGDTTVTYTVPEQYTVIIPAEASIPQGETSTTMTISIADSSTLTNGSTLKVLLESSANNFNLKSGENAITYKVEKDNSQLSASSEVISWAAGDPIPEAATLTMSLTESTEGKPAGDYTDTLTFKLTLSGTTTSGVGADDLEDGGAVGFW